MHLPAYNAEIRVPALHQFIVDQPLGILTTAIKNPAFPLIQVSHIPWVLDPNEQGTTGQGVLRGHIARQNPQAKAIIEQAAGNSDSMLDEDVLVLFNADLHHYITPKFYVETKPASGKVVPTWNYETVQVYGKATIYHDSHSEEVMSFLTAQLSDLSHHMEYNISGYGHGAKRDQQPWTVSDAPQRYIDLLKKNIIGIKIEITSISGRFKMSQEKTPADRSGVINGLKDMGNEYGVALGERVERRAAEYDDRKKQEKSPE